MKIFVTGTGTDVGKTIVSTWLCLHFGYSYWKPVQSGAPLDTDFVKGAGVKTFSEMYRLSAPLSPHVAASLDGIEIDMRTIKDNLPNSNNLVIEGAGGVMAPLNKSEFIIDLISMLSVPVIIVSETKIGTINHTCLTIHALRSYNIPILGVIMSGEPSHSNKEAIEKFGGVSVLHELPHLANDDRNSLLASVPCFNFMGMK